MATSVAWIFRAGLAGWTRLTGGGAVDWVLTMSPIAEWLSAGWHFVPLCVVPVYLWASARQQPPSQSAVVAAVVTLTLAADMRISTATLSLFGPDG